MDCATCEQPKTKGEENVILRAKQLFSYSWVPYWEMGTAPEFYEIPERNAGSIKLCDTLVTVRPDGTTGGHIRIVTGIGRDEKGEVVK